MSGANGESVQGFPDGRPAAEQPAWRRDFPIDVPEDEYVSRREFAKFLVLTSGAFAAGQCWIGLRQLLRRGDGSLPGLAIARRHDIPVGGVVEFRYPDDSEPCLLLRPSADRLVAYSQKCTHLSCALVPELDKGRLRCPCHNGYFEIAGGQPIAGPPRRPLPVIRLEERSDGTIYATGVELRTT